MGLGLDVPVGEQIVRLLRTEWAVRVPLHKLDLCIGTIESGGMNVPGSSADTLISPLTLVLDPEDHDGEGGHVGIDAVPGSHHTLPLRLLGFAAAEGVRDLLRNRSSLCHLC